MSNYYDLKCLTCAEPAEERGDKFYSAYAGFDANRGHRELLALMFLRPELEALGAAVKALKKNPEKLPAFVGWESGVLLDFPPRAAWFFADHAGHHIVVASEYWTDAFFGCDKQAAPYDQKNPQHYHRDLKPRENRADCRLDHNHEGECATARPDGK